MTLLTRSEELRLEALDRALNYCYGRDVSADEVLRISKKFDTFLKGESK